MRVSIALVSVVFALAGSAVAAPLSVDGTLKTRSGVNGSEPDSLESTVTNLKSSFAEFLDSLANLMSGSDATGTTPAAVGNATINIGGSANGSNVTHSGSANGGAVDENAFGGSAITNGNGDAIAGSGGTVISRNSGSESNFSNEIEDDPDKTNNNTKRGDGSSAVTQTGSNNQIYGSSGA